MKKIFLLIIPIIMLNSCGIFPSSNNQATENGISIPKIENIINSKWVWKETILADKTKITPTEKKSFIRFKEEGKLELSGDCNKGSAFYKLKKDIIEISPIMSTKMFCGGKSTEKEYFNELKQANNLYLKDGNLFIECKDKTALMEFEKE